MGKEEGGGQSVIQFVNLFNMVTLICDSSTSAVACNLHI